MCKVPFSVKTPPVKVKFERGSTFTFACNFPYIASILNLRPYAGKNYTTVEIHLLSKFTLPTPPSQIRPHPPASVYLWNGRLKFFSVLKKISVHARYVFGPLFACPHKEVIVMRIYWYPTPRLNLFQKPLFSFIHTRAAKRCFQKCPPV